jgi:hypothetical protein
VTTPALLASGRDADVFAIDARRVLRRYRSGGDVAVEAHPGNVMLSSRGPVVIDWRNASEGPPDLDVVLSALILAQMAADDAHDLAAPAKALLASFLAHASGEPLRMLDRAVAMRGADANLSRDEIDGLARAATLVGERG